MKVMRVSSGLSVEKICGLLVSEEAVMVRPDSVQSEEEIELALHLAKDAFAKRANIAKKLKYEFLLWLSGKTDIRRALESSEPKDSREFILVILSGGNGLREKLELKERPLKLGKKAEPLALERISLSRIR